VSIRDLLAFAVYVIAVTVIACAATWAASFLPIRDPLTAWFACVAAGCLALVAATTWLPFPCTCHRKDGRQ
jgi:hypothetical protein